VIKKSLSAGAVYTHILLVVYLAIYLATGIQTQQMLIHLKPIPESLLQDFNFYRRALQFACQRTDPYSIREIGPAFLYPPPALLVVQIFAWLVSPMGEFLVYTAVNSALLLLMTYGVASFYHYSPKTVWYWFPVALGFAPFLELIHVGQINVITQFGVFLMFIAQASNPMLAGAGLGLAIVTKVTPLAFIWYLFTNRRPVVILTTLIVIAALCILALQQYGWGPFATYPDVLRHLLGTFALGTNSQSLVAKLAVANTPEFQDALGKLPQDWQAPAYAIASFFTIYHAGLQRLLTVYMVVVLVLGGWLNWRLKQPDLWFVLISLAVTLSSGIMWYHHYVFLLIPMFVLMAWSRLNRGVVLWCLLWLLIIQVDRWHLTYGLLIHIAGQITILAILAWQVKLLRLRDRATPHRQAVVSSAAALSAPYTGH